jgi:hypothetical protein
VDSKSALSLAKNPVFHERSKHIRVRYHFIRGCLEEGSIKAGTSTPRINLPICSPSLLGGSGFWSSAPRVGWFRYLTRQHTRLRGRMMDKSLYCLSILLVFVGLVGLVFVGLLQQHMVLV